jgi:hypothetical protein
MQPLSCIVCDYQPDTAFNGCTNNQPYKATAFTTMGHYGSTFFDPMDNSQIEINVCDDCLRKAVAKKQILYYNYGNEPKYYEESDHV